MARGNWKDYYDVAFYNTIKADYAKSYDIKSNSLKIYTTSQLAALAAFTSKDLSNNFALKYVELMNDLDMSAHDWSPISMPEYNTEGNDAGSIKGYWNLGGISAYNLGGVITDCISEIVFTPTGYCTGGIVGQNTSEISNCVFSGSINGNRSTGNIGGIAGWTGASTISKCSRSGEITGGNRVGGIAGRLADNGVIEDCTSSATVKALSSGGGKIVGVNDGKNTKVINSK